MEPKLESEMRHAPGQGLYSSFQVGRGSYRRPNSKTVASAPTRRPAVVRGFDDWETKFRDHRMPRFRRKRRKCDLETEFELGTMERGSVGLLVAWSLEFVTRPFL